MAELIDERPEQPVVETDQHQQEATLEATLQPIEEPTAEPVAEEPTPEEEPIPDKYQGKDIREVIRMHQEAERWAGRQSEEVGELRKSVDTLIQAQLAQQAPKEPEPEPDFLLEPEKAVKHQIANDPTINELKQATQEYKQASAMSQLSQKHPDMREILNDKQFAEWVAKSPMRIKMFNDADQKYDTLAADELFSEWKDRKALVAGTVQAEKESRKDQVKQASTGSARGSDVPRSKPTYRRSDIVNLIKNDPDRYRSLVGEIKQAYLEKRVK